MGGGFHTGRARELMAGSIAADRANAPDYLGYNADGSDGVEYVGRRITSWSYNGIDVG